MKNTLDKHVVAYQGDNIYDFDNKIMLTWYPQRVLDHAKSSGSLLELGLGHGYTADIFSKYFKRHVVIEGSTEVIRHFKSTHPECSADIVQSYFENFETDERFDVIVMGFILEHVDDPLEVLRRYRKFLSPTGRLFLSVPNAEVLNRRLGHLAGLLDDVTSLSENDLLLGHQRYYTVETLRSLISDAGWHLTRLEGIYLKPFTTRQMLSLQLGQEVIDALCVMGIEYPELSAGLFAEVSLP